MFLAIDVFGNDAKSARLLGIDSRFLIIYAVIILFLVRHVFKLGIYENLRKAIELITLPITFICIVLSIWGAVTPTNTVFTVTHLHQSEVGFLALFGFLVVLSQKSIIWWKKYWMQITVFTPCLAFLVLLTVRTWPFDVFIVMTHEDHLIENMQFAVLINGSLWCGYWAYKSFKKNNKLQMFLCLFFAVAFFLVAGDEISWGQRILGLTTPSLLEVNNRQKEITVHNLKTVEWLVQWIYLFISFGGIFGRAITKKILPHKLKQLHTFLPTYHYIGYFIFPLIFYIGQKVVPNGIWHIWVEPMELFIYLGVVLWVSWRFSVEKLFA
jgi:hypothetical protein